MSNTGRKSTRGPIAIVGGAGFIGSNLADSFLADGLHVVVVDNLSRPGVERNLAWLRDKYGAGIHVSTIDIRNIDDVRSALCDADAVFQLAAQVAVTTSLADPLSDFSVNAFGTLNILEVVRHLPRRIPLIYASTNKVYGDLANIEMLDLDDGYTPKDEKIRTNGIGEEQALDFHTPYGCSKGVADQYVLDYARSYDIPTAVLRMSCIYGPRQFGTEDQGWVAHFALQALLDRTIAIYGNGRQMRDILHVTDAVAAYRGVLANIETVQGQAFNLGGGATNTVSLQELLRELERITGRNIRVSHQRSRTGDQVYFVADTRRLHNAIGWSPRIHWRLGLIDLVRWLETICTPAALTRSAVA